MKLGSLFDGSGGFPLAGALCGIKPKWASEIEPYPIAVTKSRFPTMKHLGDISKIKGAEIEPVDIITFGSPCQDLSVAGKRAGLKHEKNGDSETTRSGLFMEAVRIIKEMRVRTNGKYPRFAVWENVPGAFSSNKGEDFRIVLEELIKIIEPNAVMPEVPQKGWAYADSYYGNGWSLAYRVLDAQYWGVPQRRRRIYLVTDFRGQRAREILFEREGVRGHFTQGRTPWQTTSADVERSFGADDRKGAYGVVTKGNGEAFISSERHTSLSTGGGQAGQGYPCVMESAGFCPEQSAKTRGIGYEEEVAPTLRSGVTPGVTYSTIVLEGNGQRPSHQGNGYAVSNKSYTLNATEIHGVVHVIDQVEKEGTTAYGLDRASYNQGKNAKFDFTISEEKQPTLTAKGPGAVCTIGLNAGDISPTLISRMSSAVGTTQDNLIVSEKREGTKYIVRRLTPTECARLQGFADRWGDTNAKTDFSDEEYAFWLEVRNTHAAINGRKVKEYTKAQMLTWYNKLHVDSSEYKMWGNGIALPTALYVMQGIKEVSNESYKN